MWKWLWNEKFWLPEGTTWPDVTNGPDKDVTYAEAEDLWVLVPLTLVILATRYMMEKYCFIALGRWLKIKDSKRIAPHNALLEAAYDKCTSCEGPISLAKQLDMTERQVERWWRLRRSQDKPSTLVKFSENMWKGTYYLCNFSFGLHVLWDEEWLWDLNTCFEGYPHQGITTDIKIYYTISTSYYCCLIITQFWDVRRKDFWQMFLHHIATITLLMLSWIGQGHRVGTLLLLLHDSSDMILELGKAAKHAGIRNSVVTAMFDSFAVIWVLTRLVLYPYILNMTFKCFMWSPLISTICVFLFILLPLHVIWTWTIIKIVYTSATSGKVPGDTRSSGSGES